LESVFGILGEALHDDCVEGGRHAWLHALHARRRPVGVRQDRRQRLVFIEHGPAREQEERRCAKRVNVAAGVDGAGHRLRRCVERRPDERAWGGNL
jgi:hypothetical protein